MKIADLSIKSSFFLTVDEFEGLVTAAPGPLFEILTYVNRLSYDQSREYR